MIVCVDKKFKLERADIFITIFLLNIFGLSLVIIRMMMDLPQGIKLQCVICGVTSDDSNFIHNIICPRQDLACDKCIDNIFEEFNCPVCNNKVSKIQIKRCKQISTLHQQISKNTVQIKQKQQFLSRKMEELASIVQQYNEFTIILKKQQDTLKDLCSPCNIDKKYIEQQGYLKIEQLKLSLKPVIVDNTAEIRKLTISNDALKEKVVKNYKEQCQIDLIQHILESNQRMAADNLRYSMYFDRKQQEYLEKGCSRN